MNLRTILFGLAISATLSLPAGAQVVFQELLYDPVGADDGNQIVELYNPTGKAVDLSDWALYVGQNFHNHVYLFDASRTVQPGAYLTIHYRASGSGDVDDLYTQSEGSWWSRGDVPIDNAGFGMALFENDDTIWEAGDFNNENLIREFLQVGLNHGKSHLADLVGHWLVYDRIVDRGEGISVVHDGSGNHSNDYFGDVRGYSRGDNGIATSASYTYGGSCGGSGDWEPIIPDTDHIPGDAQTRFQVSLVHALGPHASGFAFMVVGFGQDAVPFGPDCTLWTTFDFLIGPLPLQGQGNGQGHVLLDAFNPAPGSGLEIFLTFFCQDPTVSKGFTLSNAQSLKF